MPAEKRRLAASILLFVQAGILVIASFFTLANPPFSDQNMMAGQVEFFAAAAVVALGAMVWRGWLPAVIAATVLCALEAVVGGPLLLVSALVFGPVLGPVSVTLSLAGPLAFSSLPALPAFVLLCTALFTQQSHRGAGR